MAHSTACCFIRPIWSFCILRFALLVDILCEATEADGPHSQDLLRIVSFGVVLLLPHVLHVQCGTPLMRSKMGVVDTVVVVLWVETAEFAQEGCPTHVAGHVLLRAPIDR